MCLPVRWPPFSEITSRPCPSPKPKPCAKKSTTWPSKLPAPQIAENFYDLGETRVLVLYPALPQNLHKLALIPIFQNIPKLAQQRLHLCSRQFVLLRHRRSISLEN